MLPFGNALPEVSVFVFVPSWSDGIYLGLALFFDVSGHHTGKTFDFLESDDTLEFVM